MENKKDVFNIGISQCSEDLWREMSNREILREATFFNDLSVEIRSVSDDSEAQIEDIRYFMDKGVDLLIVSPNESDALTPVVSQAYREGIPVILFDRKIDSGDYTAYVGADNFQIGREIGDYLKQSFKTGAPVRLLVIRGTMGSTADRERYEGLVYSLKTEEERFIIVSEMSGNFTKEEAREQMEEYLETNNFDRIDAIVAMNDVMAQGAREAWIESEQPGHVPAFLGVDALSAPGGGIDAIIDGSLTASFIYPTGGEQLIDVARRILNHISYDRDNYLGTAVVDINNARVIKLQQELIDKEQEKLDAMNQLYRDSTMLNASQKRSLFLLMAATILTVILAGALVVFNRKQRRLNQRINERNATIETQMEELADKKKQLETLTNNLERSTQAKLNFYTNVSHEFKTPLTLITGSVEEILTDPGMNDQIRSHLTIINRNSSKLLSLISEILEFRTVESGQMSVHNEPVDLRAFLSDLGQMFQDILRRRKIRMVFNCPEEEDFRMLTDKNKIEKIYFNLFSNAVKHVRGGGLIVVTLDRNTEIVKDGFRITVYNSDSYIPPEKQEDIFRQFYKLDADGESTGIGLTLTASLVSVMDGDIRVESNPSIGTEFIVELPFNPVNEEKTSNDIPTESTLYTRRRLIAEDDMVVLGDDILDEANDGRPTVLIIDDNTDMLLYIKGLLKTDYRILLAQNGERGIEKARRFLPDLVLCDIMMPGTDGYGVCETLKSSKKTTHIPIILLTACSLDEQRAAGYESGADAYIEKPFNTEFLKMRIRKLIERNKSLGEAYGNDWLLGLKDGAPDESTALLNKLKDFVEASLDKDIRIEDLTRHLGMSKATLYRKLSEVTDYSPVDIISLIRLRNAINLIRFEGKDISEAAFQSGFNSASYFSRKFQKYYKISPREWIQQNC